MNTIKIAIVEDQLLFRQSLATLIKSYQEFELIAEAGNGKSFLEIIKMLPQLPDVALVDMNMPEINGVELNTILHRHYPAIKVIALSVYSQERFITKMIDAGACGYLLKNCDTLELVNAIHTVQKNGFYLTGYTLDAIRNAAQYRNRSITNINHIPIELTNREQEILQLICSEYNNAEISEKLFLSIRTVEGHRNNLLLKTGCRNTAGLVLFAVKHNLFEVGF